MRTESKMMRLILEGAADERIRLVTLEGSRTNVNISRDIYQDYDISYFVTDMDEFKENEAWLEMFGKRIFMQTPEAMELFPPELGNWFSYLMLFEDGNRIDLTLIPIEEVEEYFQKSDGLVEVLLDKDSRVKSEVKPTDEAYWIKKPTAREFDDCCNEFWWVATYVAKGLARGEMLYAIDHLHNNVRPNLLRMIGWKIGLDYGYTFSLGKNYKFINRYLPEEDWETLLSTYIQNNEEAMWQALFDCFILFRAYSKVLAKEFNYPYPSYDTAITTYIGTIRDRP
ncbi:aminoglycoside 6-adenylyltransferase [Ralstonia pickettii]|nr:aminoglycoside 6-adenylyltransferase [Ralstonia pickettii]